MSPTKGHFENERKPPNGRGLLRSVHSEECKLFFARLSNSAPMRFEVLANLWSGDG